ncbi:MAG: DUF423 domain-containing protein [Brevundimonas sp.]|uniref:DUF423 domain-containing protein n=1 Tax=Brevundimonas sp. TaxID=1871086 RepID=UPI0027243788|nr:DUF423 domain-containing protein [Brevundimonas sp.]MDO9079030.1 DUF423 domain-containing protein [Brevundimonas sp.]MDP3080941.1 DUF423 domain-containing protein [Brevundimonas sp.]MDZ4060990.1 DUF423 domain-containing protein [Brevundimonas sp.]
MTISRQLAAFAALNGALAVLIGAFAAHGTGPQIKTLLTTGSHYQMVHAVLALLCAVWPARGRLVVLAGWLSALGGLVFCLALSAIGLLGLTVMGAVAPIGGVLMIAAWLLLLVAALRSQSTPA